MKGLYSMTVAQRIAAFSVVDESSGCWLWNQSLYRNGYARLSFKGKEYLAHRKSYEAHVGPIPEGKDLDHTCHDSNTCKGGDICLHRRCVNPWHLEPVTRKVNLNRSTLIGKGGGKREKEKTHCPQGHPYNTENTKVTRKAHRLCRECARIRANKTYRENREAILSRLRAKWKAAAQAKRITA